MSLAILQHFALNYVSNSKYGQEFAQELLAAEIEDAGFSLLYVQIVIDSVKA